MNVLGLHFGHDASVAVIRNGELVSCVERERLARVKHVIGLHSDDILLSLADAGLQLSDIDYCAITSTQLVECVLLDPDNLSLDLVRDIRHTLPCTLVDELNLPPREFAKLASGAREHFFSPGENKFYRPLLPDADRLLQEPRSFYGSFEHFIDSPIWRQTRTLKDISQTDYRDFLYSDSFRHGFHYPGRVHIKGHTLPCYYYSHHFAHAAYSFYESPFEEAAILTHDGGGGGGYTSCGFFAYGYKNRLVPITPHHLHIGEIYDFAANSLGLGVVGGAGKLMGLSAYGNPRFFSHDWVGNFHDLQERAPSEWMEHCLSRAQQLGYDLAPLGKKDQILAPINVDIAASTQKLAEEILSLSVTSLHEALLKSGVRTKNICFSGGFALNCPGNRSALKGGPYEKVFVPPAIHDGGLSAGAALALYYNLADQPRTPKKSSPKQAYLGLASSAAPERIRNALAQFEHSIEVTELKDTAAEAAQMLSQNKIVAWFDGRSEIGPRALGHRSILSNPKYIENWKRVNIIKGRESWRPLAPVILEEDIDEHYENLDQPSYFMLFNFMVRSKDTPATTHVDGSARVQMVNADCGEFHRILKFLKEKTGSSAVMNTSFNGPGEPVVELPEHAIRFLLNSPKETPLDALFFPGYKVTRKTDEAQK